MKFLATVFFVGSILVLLQGCGAFKIVSGSGRVSEESRTVHNFDEVALSGIGTLHISVGRKESLRIEAEDNLLPYLTAEVQHNRLDIGTKNGVWLRNTKPIHFYLVVTELDTIVLSGRGEIKAPDLLTDSFSLTVSGSGKIEMGALETQEAQVKISGSGNVQFANVDANHLKVLISGSGDLNIGGGDVEQQKVTISGSGKYLASDLESDQTNVHITGNGVVEVYVSRQFDVRVSGSGDVRYAGQPEVDQKVSGSGRVRPIKG